MGVPNNIILPFVGVEFNNSRASKGAGTLVFQTLLTGQKTASGTGVPGTVIRVSSADAVAVAAGYGSQLHLMAKEYFKNNAITDTFIYMLEDAVGSVKAQFTITFTGTATKGGEIAMLIDGYRIPVSVASGDDPTDIASAAATAISAVLPYIPVSSASASSGVLTLTAKNGGTLGNGMHVTHSYYDGEVLPTGVSVAVVNSVPGTGDPSLADMISDIGEEWYQVFCSPYTDSSNMELIETELASRFSVMRQIDGVYISARKGTDAELITFATDTLRNSPHCGVAAAGDYPMNVAQIAGAIAGAFAASASQDTAKPLHRINLNGILPPVKEKRRKFIERNTLALNGLMTLNPGNGVQSEATVTMYLKNSAGVKDTSYQQMNNMFVLMVLRYRFIQQILLKYSRAKLADNTDNIGPNQEIITPAIGKGEALMWFKQAQYDGLVENYDAFKSTLQCYRDTANRNKLIWGLGPDLMNQFIVGSGDMFFEN